MTFASEHMSSQNSGRLSALLLWFAEKCPHCLRGCCAHAWHGPPGLRRWLQRDGDPPKQPSCAGVAAMGEPGWPHGQDGVMGRAFLTGAMGNKECRPPSCSNHLFLPSSNFYPDASLSIFFCRLGVSLEGKSSRDAPDTALLLHEPPTTQCSAKGTKSTQMTNVSAPTEVTEGTGHRVIPQAPS